MESSTLPSLKIVTAAFAGLLVPPPSFIAVAMPIPHFSRSGILLAVRPRIPADRLRDAL